MVRRVFYCSGLILLFCGRQAAFAQQNPEVAQNEKFETNVILKGNLVLGVPNLARAGGSFHRVLRRSGGLMFTLGIGANLGLAVGDVMHVGRKISVEENYANLGLLPGIHILSSGGSFLFALNGVFGGQYTNTTIGDPKFAPSSDNITYQVTANPVKDYSVHAGFEGGVYYLLGPAFFGIELGFVATQPVRYSYSVDEANVKSNYEYKMPIVRYSGVRVAVTFGSFF